MSQEPMDENKIKAALRQQTVNHDPAKEDQAIKAALMVYKKEIQKRNEKKRKSFRGFGDLLRQFFETPNNQGVPMSKKWAFAVPTLAAVAVMLWAGAFFGPDFYVRTTGREVPENIHVVQPPEVTTLPPAAPARPEAAPVVPQRPVPAPQKLADNRVDAELKQLAAPSFSSEASKSSVGGAKAGGAPLAMLREQAMPADSMAIGKIVGGYIDITIPPHFPGNERFSNATEQSVKQVAQEPVSTFSMDVDTASYTFVRKMLNMGQLPPPDAVRVEEMINYFTYKYKAPENKDEPFAATVAVYPCPWNSDAKLLHVGVKAYQVPAKSRPKANIVFLMDVSGSMSPANRLPMLKNAMASFVDSLRDDDRISIVTYASQSGVALDPTSVREKDKIKQALASLGAGGSTAGGAGLRTAYELAERNFDKESTNRVILATDGDFNVGVSDPNELQKFIEEKREKGIYLTILGVGEGNLNDNLMQRLAQYGNGTAAYLDSLNEARKVLGDQVDGALVPVANDAKVQIEFNPARVAEYRLIGYETRNLRREDFNNDKVDAGDVGSGQTVTAIFEITPTDSKARQVDPLRYEQPKKAEDSAVKTDSKEYAFLKIRYKLPGSSTSKLMTQPIGTAQEVRDAKELNADLRFASAVAGFGQLLRNSTMLKNFGYEDVIKMAETSLGDDTNGARHEFLTLARAAKTAAELRGMPPQPPTDSDPPVLYRVQ